MTHSRIIARCVLMLWGTIAATAAIAQDAFPSTAAAAADEKAQKQADRTMYWIRVLAQSAAPRAAPLPKATAASAVAPLRSTAATERVKVAAATGTLAARPAPSSADVVNAVPASVVAPAPAAVAPSLAAATGVGSIGNASALSARGIDTGAAAGLAAPAIAATQIDVPPVEEEPDPGLIMIKSADPEFPVATMRRLRKGEVEVKFEVGADGAVAAVTVMKTTNPSLNAAAMEAVRQWRFKPTPRGHTAMVDLAFNLDS
jgi:protein TonB